jgi:hypothetical protein
MEHGERATAAAPTVCTYSYTLHHTHTLGEGATAAVTNGVRGGGVLEGGAISALAACLHSSVITTMTKS